MWPHLFICENEQHGVSEFVLSEHSGQLLPRLVHSLPVVAVHHKDEPCVQKYTSLLWSTSHAFGIYIPIISFILSHFKSCDWLIINSVQIVPAA